MKEESEREKKRGRARNKRDGHRKRHDDHSPNRPALRVPDTCSKSVGLSRYILGIVHQIDLANEKVRIEHMGNST
jgi:hypothetical protein